jgi:hypothetical protein
MKWEKTYCEAANFRLLLILFVVVSFNIVGSGHCVDVLEVDRKSEMKGNNFVVDIYTPLDFYLEADKEKNENDSQEREGLRRKNDRE